MNSYIIKGGYPLSGVISVSGSKNVVTKAVIAACLTEEPVTIQNTPHISDLEALLEVIESIGGKVERGENEVTITVSEIKNNKISLTEGARVRTSSMFIAPLLQRAGKAIIPNPQGCRIGARPIERHIEGLEKMGVKVTYYSKDGYYHAKTEGLKGATYKFEKNTHTGTETLIMAGVLAEGRTIIENAAEEHEIDDLIKLLNKMGGRIKREKGRKIIIDGVKRLHGTTHRIISDSNELVTLAVLSTLSRGELWIKNAELHTIATFIDEFKKVGGEYKEKNGMIHFFAKEKLKASNITTAPEPGFKTDWQGPWAILMTQANGQSSIHETIYENRFGYVNELKKMGANISFFQPEVSDPQDTYNFNYNGDVVYRQAIKIIGPTNLHDAMVKISDLRAGATLIIGALIADGKSLVSGTEHIERGYENFDKRLKKVGANIITQV